MEISKNSLIENKQNYKSPSYQKKGRYIYTDPNTPQNYNHLKPQYEKKIFGSRIVELKKTVFEDIGQYQQKENASKKINNLKDISNFHENYFYDKIKENLPKSASQRNLYKQNNNNKNHQQLSNRITENVGVPYLGIQQQQNSDQNIFSQNNSQYLNSQQQQQQPNRHNLSVESNNLPNMYQDTSNVLSTISQVYLKPNFTPFVKERDHLGKLLGQDKILDGLDSSRQCVTTSNQDKYNNFNGRQSGKLQSKSLAGLKIKRQLTESGEILLKNQKYLKEFNKNKQYQQIQKLYSSEFNQNIFDSHQTSAQQYNDNILIQQDYIKNNHNNEDNQQDQIKQIGLLQNTRQNSQKEYSFINNNNNTTNNNITLDINTNNTSVNHSKEKKKIKILGEDNNAFKLNQLNNDKKIVDQSFDLLLQNLGQKITKKNLDEQNSILENNKKYEQLMKFHGNAEESYKSLESHNRGKPIKEKEQLVAVKMENLPFFYDTQQYCKVLKPRIPEIAIMPERKKTQLQNDIQNKQALKDLERFKNQYGQAKQITREILRAQYLAKLPQNPLKGLQIGKERINKQLEEQKSSINKQDQLSNQVSGYTSDQMLNFESQLMQLKSNAKKIKNNLLAQREKQIKKYNEQTMRDFEEDQQAKIDRNKRLGLKE